MTRLFSVAPSCAIPFKLPCESAFNISLNQLFLYSLQALSRISDLICYAQVLHPF